uniref:XK-related protein n=1 Tax=Ditylenchus dipsaci TaxID=166011 RepID=A0A915DS29_9BILA
MAEGSTKLQYTVAYTIEFVEGVILMGLCLWKESFDYPYKYHIAAIALTCFVVGLSIMLVYYAFFHPAKD